MLVTCNLDWRLVLYTNEIIRFSMDNWRVEWCHYSVVCIFFLFFMCICSFIGIFFASYGVVRNFKSGRLSWLPSSRHGLFLVFFIILYCTAIVIGAHYVNEWGGCCTCEQWNKSESCDEFLRLFSIHLKLNTCTIMCLNMTKRKIRQK